MKRRTLFRVGLAVLLVVGLALLVPGSPFYLPDIAYSGGYYDGRSTRSWVKDLHRGDREQRRRAIFAIGAIGPPAKKAVPDLMKVLAEDADGHLRSEAALALSKIGPEAREAVPVLSRALDDPEPFVRMNAVWALFSLRTEARAAVPDLLRIVPNPDNHTNVGAFHATIHEVALIAVGRATAGTDEAVPQLTAFLTDGEFRETRRGAARGLAAIGPPARSAAPHLRALLADESLRVVAADALADLKEPLEGPVAQVKKGAHYELPEAERKYLWQVEHHGNVLVRYGFGPLASALNAGDRDALMKILSGRFRGSDLDHPVRVEAKTESFQVERLQPSLAERRALDRNGFAHRLLEMRGAFDDPPAVKVSLVTLSPTERGNLDGLWQGTAQLRLHGQSRSGAAAEIVVHLRFQALRPREADLAKPGWLRGADITQVSTARAKKPLFVETARERGFKPDGLHDNWKSRDFSITSGGAFVTDFDRDGFLDVLITDLTGARLYRGQAGGKFVDVTSSVGLPAGPMVSPRAAWADLDGDGWDDLILGRQVFKNEAGAKFTDVTDRASLRMPHDAANIVVADYDRDGRLDLYFTRPGKPGHNSWLDSKSGDPKGNYLFRNRGDWQFEDVTVQAKAGGGRRSTFTAAWLDANNDGWPDLHVPNEFGDGVLLMNNRDGTFREQPLANRPADFGTMGLAVGDLDNDGHIDLYAANMYSKAGTRVMGNLDPKAYPEAVLERMRRFVAGSQFHRNRGDGKFEQVGIEKQVAAVGWAYGPALADFDGDGFLDIYATAGYVSRNRDKPDG